MARPYTDDSSARRRPGRHGQAEHRGQGRPRARRPADPDHDAQQRRPGQPAEHLQLHAGESAPAPRGRRTRCRSWRTGPRSRRRTVPCRHRPAASWPASVGGGHGLASGGCRCLDRRAPPRNRPPEPGPAAGSPGRPRRRTCPAPAVGSAARWATPPRRARHRDRPGIPSRVSRSRGWPNWRPTTPRRSVRPGSPWPRHCSPLSAAPPVLLSVPAQVVFVMACCRQPVISGRATGVPRPRKSARTSRCRAPACG